MRAALLAVAFLVAGCTHLDVQDMGRGRYSLTASAPSGGFYGSREEAVERANEFCGTQRRSAVVDGFYDKSQLGPLGEHSSSILFRCAAPAALHF